MNNRYLGGKLGQMQCLLDGGVTAADHGNFLVPVKRGVAGSAVRHPFALQLFLARDFDLAGFGTSAEDNGTASQLFAVFQGNGLNVTCQVQRTDCCEFFLQPEPVSMRGHLVHQFKATDAIRESGIIIHPIGYQNLAPNCPFFKKQGL